MIQKPTIAIIAVTLIAFAMMSPSIVAADQSQALIEAAKKGDLKHVRDLLDKGAEVDAKNGDDETALMAAAEAGKLELVKLFIEKGANVKATDHIGQTALQHAARGGNLDVVKFLIKKGADVNARNVGGMTVLLTAAQRGKSLDVVKLLIEKGADTKAKANSDVTLLIAAAWGGNLELVKYLIEKGADIKDKDFLGSTVLMYAAEGGNLDVVKFLIEKGANAKARGNDGQTVLMVAAYSGKLEIVKLLIEKGADLQARAKNGRTVLMYAALGGNLDVVKFLIEKGADINAKDDLGLTVLMHAAGKGNLDVVKFLSEKGLDVRARGKCGLTALMYAAHSGKLEIVKLLIEKGADLQARAKNGRTVLMYAALGGNLDVVKFLIEKGADVNAEENDPGIWADPMNPGRSFTDEKSWAIAARRGWTALKIAEERGHKEIVEYLKAHGARETSGARSLSHSDMWAIAALLLIAFAFIWFSRIARKRWVAWVFVYLGAAVWSVVCFWVLPTENGAWSALMAFPMVSAATSHLFAIPILRRRVIPPSVRVRRTPIYRTVNAFFFVLIILFVSWSFSSPRMMLFGGLLIASTLIYLILILSERVQICGNGVSQDERMRPWEEYESFSWKRKTKYGVELWIVPKSWRSWVYPSQRLLVAPEDLEAVQQILEANLPDQSSSSEGRNT